VVFGPEFAASESRTVENAWQEAQQFKPDILLFCAFQFDEEAVKDIDELTPEITGMHLLKCPNECRFVH
jgi:adenine-specific DNA-methyltransferase